MALRPLPSSYPAGLRLEPSLELSTQQTLEMEQALSDNKLHVPDTPMNRRLVNSWERQRSLRHSTQQKLFTSPPPRDGFLSPLPSNQLAAGVFLDVQSTHIMSILLPLDMQSTHVATLPSTGPFRSGLSAPSIHRQEKNQSGHFLLSKQCMKQ